MSSPELAIVPVRPVRSFDDVVRQLRQLIYGGAVRVGERLPSERVLAEQFQVSRNMVREGLRTLESAGLIELRLGRNGGAFVSSGRPEFVTQSLQDMLRLGAFTLDDLAEARSWLSTTIVRAAAERATSADLDRLASNVAESAAHVKARRWDQLARTNMHFLDLLAECTKNPVLQIIHDGVMGVIRQISGAIGPIKSDKTVRHRERIVELMRAADVEGAVEEMAANLRDVHQYWQREMAGARTIEELISGRAGTRE